MLVLDEGLIEGRLTIDDVDEIVHDPSLAIHDQVKVPQTHVEVDDYGLMTFQGESCRDGGARGGFTHTTFSRGNNDDFTQLTNPD
ncbi:hypothetical protein GCM10022278_36250 [Allohahella marinimesophila]|uniref:Uncharacterized protein n=1 Tax=Allohahella marinimesophila TaxID=1054972 RepID=A0ABP7Q3X3_9GAMM